MSILDRLATEQRIAVLAGAGISLDPPSNLLDGRTFVQEVVVRLVPPSVPISWFMEQVELHRERRCRPGEMLRFEQLMMTLADRLDPDLTVLDCLRFAREPNANHYFLARLIREGHVVITTNFDDLIERAYIGLYPGAQPVLQVAIYEEEFPTPLPPYSKQPILWKIHGSLDRAGRSVKVQRGSDRS